MSTIDDKTIQESGVLLVDKPTGWTSHDVVGYLRRFGIKKVGHCGTLDPSATGLLVIVLGRATKLADKFTQHDKVYEGTMTIGIDTDTQDAEGEVVQTRDWSHVTAEQITEVCADFVGEQMQMPPMYSAVKVGGQELYKLARKGQVVERPARQIVIHSLDVTAIALPDISITAKCSKGTYVRTLCTDIGDKLGSGAHVKTLRRTVSGRLNVVDATDMETIKTWDRETLLEKMIPLASVMAYF
jgi:tRNA pseudouridine55 synthase